MTCAERAVAPSQFWYLSATAVGSLVSRLRRVRSSHGIEPLIGSLSSIPFHFRADASFSKRTIVARFTKLVRMFAGSSLREVNSVRRLVGALGCYR